MNKEIESIISVAHGPRRRSDQSVLETGQITQTSTWVPSDYIERVESLKKFGKILSHWQEAYAADGSLPDGAAVKALWAKIIAVEVLHAEDRKLKNDLMYGETGCQYFYERT